MDECGTLGGPSSPHDPDVRGVHHVRSSVAFFFASRLHVVAADGGQAGIDAFVAAQRRGEPFTLVLSDLGMPHVDGRKVASVVKRASPNTPVVLVTGWGQRMHAQNEVPSDVDRVLSKPPKLSELREALATLAGS